MCGGSRRSSRSSGSTIPRLDLERDYHIRNPVIVEPHPSWHDPNEGEAAAPREEFVRPSAVLDDTVHGTHKVERARR